MNLLEPLRKRLKSVARRRFVLDCLAVASRLLVEACVLLLLFFAIDFLLRLVVAWRLVFLTAVGSYLLWRLIVLTRPVRQRQAGLIDVALLLERRQPLANALVAGLQFEQASLPRGSSQQLTTQVTAEAAACESQLDYSAILPTAEFRRQAIRAVGAVAGVVAIAALFPQHSQAFAARLLLNDTAYPTQTRIVEIRVDKRVLNLQQPIASIVEDTPVSFSIRASGKLPESGTIKMQDASTGETKTVRLDRQKSSDSNGLAVYDATGPKLKDPAAFSVELGDARAGEFRIAVVRRPIVELQIQATPPEYAQPVLTAEITQDRRVGFLHGSTVSFQVRSANGKRLRAVTLDWSTDSASGTVSFSKASSGPTVWRDEATASAWRPLDEPLRFVLSVVDEDDLPTLHPIEGRIDVRPDLPPTGSLRTDYPLVVPTAQPLIRYEASDDFGVSSLHFELFRQRSGDVSLVGKLDVPTSKPREAAGAARIVGERSVDLSPFDLRNGDRLLVKLIAVDERGELPGESFTSEPAEIEIGDEARVLKAILQADATAEQLLTEAIEQESVLKEEP